MKNTLAENMLRFGVKNLSDRSKKKLAEQLLDEAPAAAPNVQSMLSIPGVGGTNIVQLKATEANVKVITINTKAETPVAAGYTLYGVRSNAGDIVFQFGGYNLIIGNIGIYNTESSLLETLSLRACFTVGQRIAYSIPITDYITSEDGIAKLFAILCLTAKNKVATDAGSLYNQQYNNLISAFKYCTLTKTAPIPTGGDPTKDMVLAAFNKKVGTYISKRITA